MKQYLMNTDTETGSCKKGKTGPEAGRTADRKLWRKRKPWSRKRKGASQGKRRCGGTRIIRCAAFMLAALLAAAQPVPRAALTVRAQERTAVATKEICHYHTGEPGKEGGCYTVAVPHKHTGSAGNCGGCYQTPIYHIHTGDREKGGGCYAQKVCHKHTGSESRQGGCYGTPVYHKHEGSAAAWGGCYVKPVYHVHAGSPEAGGSCYTPVYHTHGDGCYQDANCLETIVGGYELLRTYKEYCTHDGNTQHAEIRAVYQHTECGLGQVEETHNMCWGCQIFNKHHTWQKAVCGKNGDTLEGYRLSCTRGSGDVERWEPGCNKTEATVERYALSCGKTPESVEYYNRSCEKDEKSIDAYALSCKRKEGETESYKPGCEREEHRVYARIRLQRTEAEDGAASGAAEQTASVPQTASGPKKTSGPQKASESRTVPGILLTVTCEDESGFLKGWSGAYRWTRDGEELPETKDQLQIAQNGCYTVSPDYTREDLKQEELIIACTVDDIKEAGPEEKPVEPDPDGDTTDKDKTDPDDTTGTDDPTDSDDKKDTDDKTDGEGGDTTDPDGSADSEADRDKEKDSAEDEKKENGGNGDSQNSGESHSGGGGNGNGGSPAVDGVQKKEPQKQPEVKEEPKNAKRKGKAGKTGSESSHKKPSLSFPLGNTEAALSGAAEEPATGSVEESDRKYKKETEEVRTEPVAAAPPSGAENVKRTGLRAVAEPVVKAVTFTVGTVAALAGIFWLIYLALFNVRVYYNEGDEKRRYAGSCMLKRDGEGYELELPAMLLEQSGTGLLTLRPGRLFNRLHKGEELLVTAGKQKESVWIGEEIPFHVFTFV